jgi:hypothetical protein
MFIARKLKYQSPSYFEAGTHWGNAFRTQVIRTVPLCSVVISAECVRAAGKLKVPGTAHWLSRFLIIPTESLTADRRYGSSSSP